MKRVSMKIVLMTFFTLSIIHTRNANSIACDVECLPPVTVTGIRLWGFFPYNIYITYPASLFWPGYGATRGSIGGEDYTYFQEQVAKGPKNPFTTTDVRCSLLVTAFTAATTSKDDGNARYLAAQQLFAALVAENGILGIRAIIAGSPPQIYNGKLAATFRVTLADGGTETHIVTSTSSPTLLVDAALPPPPTGDGVVKPCPN